MRLGVTVLAAAAVLATAPAVSADDREAAKALAAEGTALARAGKLEQAIAKYKQADTTAASAVNDCNIGLAYVRLSRWHQGEMFFSRCRRRWAKERGDKPLPTWLAQTDAQLQAELARGGYAPVTIDLEGGGRVRASAFAADEWLDAPVTLYLAPGKHVITGERDGQQTTQDLEIASAEAQRVELTIEVVVTPPEGDRESERTIVTGPVAEPTRESSRLHWIVGGVGVAALAGGGVAHVLAASKRSDAADTEAGDDFDKKLDAFKTRRAVAVALYATGAVGLGVAYVLYRRSSRESPRIDVALGDGGASASVGWAF